MSHSVWRELTSTNRSIGNHLSHLLSVIENLEPAWARAFLRRTRFLDAEFQGDVLAVISTCDLVVIIAHRLLINKQKKNRSYLNGA
jgi:hypothetical protein